MDPIHKVLEDGRWRFTIYVTAGTDIAVTAISAPAVAPLPDGVRVLDHALPERACTDWVPARNVRPSDTDR